jgi:hypothetical protein
MDDGMQNAMRVMTGPPEAVAPPLPPAVSPDRPAGVPAETLGAVRAGLPVPVAPGRHRLAGDEACLMELASALAHEPWGDHPAGVHPVLAAVARAVNDRVGDGTRARLAALVPSMAGTADAGPDGYPRPELCARLVLLCARTALAVSPFLAAEMNSAALTALSVLARREGPAAHQQGPAGHQQGPAIRAEGSAVRRAAASLLDRRGLLGRVYGRHAAGQAAQAVSVIAGAAGEARLAGLLRDCVDLCVANVQEAGRDGSLG